MSQPFVGQIQPLAFGFAPRGWAQCNGQTLSISQNIALFSLLGTMYGGNGVSTFMLPNLQSAVPMHVGTSPSGNTYVQGESAGKEQVQLTLGNMPMHNHLFFGTTGCRRADSTWQQTALCHQARLLAHARFAVIPARFSRCPLDLPLSRSGRGLGIADAPARHANGAAIPAAERLRHRRG
jgi:microcystin-dependent protein